MRRRTDGGLVLGVTGGIACGKTVVTRILQEEYGVPIKKADRVAADLLQPGTPQYCQVVEYFGKSILSPSGELDRFKLGEIVFSDAIKLARLNEIVHPAVFRDIEDWVAVRRNDSDIVAVELPLLYESGFVDLWDLVICVASREELVLQRLQRRGLAREQALRRIAAQMDLEKKKEKSDYILINDRSIDELSAKTGSLLNRIEAERMKDEREEKQL